MEHSSDFQEEPEKVTEHSLSFGAILNSSRFLSCTPFSNQKIAITYYLYFLVYLWSEAMQL